MKTIIVTGGAGFIGSHLCKRLLDEGNYVICFDNFFTGRLENIKDLINNKNFELITGDVIEPMEEIISGFHEKVDEIYNLACPASPPHYQYDPIKTAQTNFLGMYNVLMLAKKFKSKVLQASTSEVYGDPKIHPQPEDYRGNVNPDGIRACYDEGKRIAETLCFDFHRQYGVDIKIVRIFNTYGPNMREDDGRVVSNFIWQALKGDDLTIYGNGSQTRSFCYVDDLVDGMIKMMASNITGPVNLGNPGEFTIRQLADIVLEMIDTESQLVHKDLPSDDPTMRKPNINLAKKELNWEPKIQLREGLEKTIKYFKSKC